MLTITQFQSEFFSLKIEKTHKIGLSVTLFEHFVYYWKFKWHKIDQWGKYSCTQIDYQVR